MRTKILIAIGILAVLVVVLWVRGARPVQMQNPAQNTVSNENVEQKPAAQTIEQYVTQNISALSPVKEQVGGKFYVTKIEAHGGAGTVYYEDGHNAYTADFTYEVDLNGVPGIRTFIVRRS